MNRQIHLNQNLLDNQSETEQERLKLLNDCAQVLSAVADPTRLMIVKALMDGPASVSDLAERIGGDVSSASHHLKILKRAGLVTAQRKAKLQIHSLAPGVKVPARGRRPARLKIGCCSVMLSK